MNYLFSLASLMTVSMPVQAETVYLLIKNTGPNGTSALYSIPMTSPDMTGNLNVE